MSEAQGAQTDGCDWEVGVAGRQEDERRSEQVRERDELDRASELTERAEGMN